MKLPQWSRRPWWLAGVTLAVALVPVWLTWQNYRIESRRKDEQLFHSTADLVAEKMLVKVVRHVNALNMVRNFLRSNRDARPDLPPAFQASLPYLTAYAYLSEEEGRLLVRWAGPEAKNRLASEGQALDLTPGMKKAFLSSMEGSPMRPAGVRWDESHMLIIQAMQGMANYPRSHAYLAGWVNLVGLCHDQDEPLVRDKIISVEAWRQEAVLPEDAKLYDQREGDVAWTLVVSRGSNYGAKFGQMAPLYVLIGGGASALMLAFLVGLATSANQLQAALSSERQIGRMRSQFVSSVSHEFRTPLSVILSGADLLEAHTAQLTPERRTEAFAQIKDATHRMNDMVEQVLLLGHIESGALKVNRQPVDVAALCRGIVDEVDLATQKKCLLTIEGPRQACEPLMFALDANLLRSVLGNLVGNAVKYSAPCATVVLVYEVSESAVRFEIRDHGIGIPAADQARLFEPFHRGSNVGETPGTGLGLTIVDRCLQLHGGTLTVDSEVGVGTTIAFEVQRL